MAQTEPRSDAGPRGRPRDASADHRILAATFRQLVAVGYPGLSVEAVAAEAGVAKTTIYRRYPTKRELTVAALSQEAPFPPPSPQLHGRDAIERFVRQAVAMLIESGAVRILGSLLVEEQRDPGILAAFRERILEPRRALVAAMLRRGIERGEIRPDIDPLVVTEMIAGAVFGHHVILGQLTSDAWVESLVDHIWAAIRA
ncbi:MAG TPA: TetR-like C-terminal domain-containing protein [Candidatus Limnocylindrales bacterium]|nr:TetR-like C-terminal domain-containing protein [Candidatus Limnocylindrales bacterium]